MKKNTITKLLKILILSSMLIPLAGVSMAQMDTTADVRYSSGMSGGVQTPAKSSGAETTDSSNTGDKSSDDDSGGDSQQVVAAGSKPPENEDRDDFDKKFTRSDSADISGNDNLQQDQDSEKNDSVSNINETHGSKGEEYPSGSASPGEDEKDSGADGCANNDEDQPVDQNDEETRQAAVAGIKEENGKESTESGQPNNENEKNADSQDDEYKELADLVKKCWRDCFDFIEDISLLMDVLDKYKEDPDIIILLIKEIEECCKEYLESEDIEGDLSDVEKIVNMLCDELPIEFPHRGDGINIKIGDIKNSSVTINVNN